MSLVELARSLLDAAKRGNDQEVTDLMANGAPFTTDWLGTSPLHLACKYGHLSTAEILLRAGISKDARTKVDQTPLHVSCMKGHGHVAEMLLRYNANVNALDMLRMTPLHWAAERGYTSLVKCLVKYDADISLKNKFEKTAFDIAQSNNHHDIARLLRDKRQEAETILPTPSNLVRPGPKEAGKVNLSKIRPVETITVNKDIFTENSGSSTSVLATLAALAEASTPLKSPGGPEVPLSDGTIPHGTQTLILTDAGKLALGISPDTKGKRSHDQDTQEITTGGRNPESSTKDESQNAIKKQKTTLTLQEASLDPTKTSSNLCMLDSNPLEQEILTIVCGENGEMIIERERDKVILQQRLDKLRQEAEGLEQQLKEREAAEMSANGNRKSPRKQTLETRSLANHEGGWVKFDG